jgi:hypothetical protein
MSNKTWHQQPILLGLIKLLKFRRQLRENNLHDTSQLDNKDLLPKPSGCPFARYLKARTDDGSYNDLEHPEMGMAGTRFGRNVPLKEAYQDSANLMNPNPRLVSQKLLTREEFQPATILNLLAAAWIQFQTHDWFSHGDNQPDNKFELEIDPNDPLWARHSPMEIKKTLDDPTHTGDLKKPPTFINHVTHWWDGSQIYGSDEATVNKLRSHVDGKMLIGEDGLLPLNPETGFDDVGFAGAWWLGLGLLHNLFIKEHNYICDRLKAEYPYWNDDELFDRARLINAALMAKIHTVEWTPAILPNPVTDKALNTNWWGILGEDFKKSIGKIGDSEILSGIIGSSKDHHTAPYYLTEEFVSVYRMHPLIPDEFDFYQAENGEFWQKLSFPELSGQNTRKVMEEGDLASLFYSFGVTHPGAVRLHNYPNFLQQLKLDSGDFFDLGSVDILRDRERGVPRYNRFRELVGMGKVKSFEEITSNPVWAKELREVYNNDLESVDLMVGLFAEDLPDGFGFSETAFRIFILMASRRLKSDRFFTEDYREEVYTSFGLQWIDRNGLASLLARHYPSLRPALAKLGGTKNPFAPWK